MKKTILLFLMLLISIIPTLNTSVKAVENYEISGLNLCDQIFLEAGSYGVFAYGIYDDTLCVCDCDSETLRSVTVKGKMRARPIFNSGKVCCIYQDEALNYNLIFLDVADGRYKTVFIGKSNQNRYSQFTVTDNSLFLMTTSVYTYVSEYNFDGECICEYSFERQNVNSLFINSEDTYAVLANGEIYMLKNGASTYCTSVYTNASLKNAGEGYVVDSENTVYSLKENKVVDTFSYSSDCISISGNTVCYSSGDTLYLSEISGSVTKSYKLKSKIELLAIKDNKAYIMTDDSSRLLIVDFDEFSACVSADTDKVDVDSYKTNTYNSYKFDNDIICNIPASTKVKDFCDSFTKSVTITDENGNEVTGSNLKTGYIAQIFDKKYTLAIQGDITGTGTVNSRDVSLLMDSFIGKNQIFGAYKKAADFNLDGFVDNKDLLLISRDMD